MKHLKYRLIQPIVLAYILCCGYIRNITGASITDVATLLNGVSAIRFETRFYPPVKLSVFGKNAAVVATALLDGDQVSGQSPIVACSTMENGNKFVVYGIDTFTVNDTNSKKFLSNSLNWMSPGNGPYNIGIKGSLDLNANDTVKFKQMSLNLDSLSQYNIIVVNDINPIDDANLIKMKSFLESSSGKGLIVGISGYYKAYLSDEYLRNRSQLIAIAGILWTNIWNYMSGNSLEVNQAVLPTTHVSYAVSKIRSGVEDKRNTRIVDEFIRSFRDDPFSGYYIMSTPPAPPALTDDVGILLTDIKTIQFVRDGWSPPFKLSVFGTVAKVLASALRNKDQADGPTPIIACSTTENGNKVVVFGYRTFIEGNYTDSKKFLSNILNWMSPGNGTYNIGISKGSIALNGTDISKFKQAPLDLESLSQYDIIFVDDVNTINNTNLEKLKAYLQLIDKGLVVGISSLYDDQYLTDEHLQKKSELIAPYGIFWTNVWNDMSENSLEMNPNVLPTAHILYAFNKLRNGDFDQRYVRLLREYMRSYTKTAQETCGCDFMSRLVKDYRSGKLSQNRIIPSPNNAITDAKAKNRIRIESDIEKWIVNNLDPESITAHPASYYYPGMEFKDWGKPFKRKFVIVKPVKPKTFVGLPSPSKNFSVCQKVDVKKAVPLVIPPYRQTTVLWYPTGMYARPGEVVTLQFPKSVNISQIKVRVGTNRDDFTSSNEPFLRFPKIDVELQVLSATFRIASAFGGLIYIVLPINYTAHIFAVYVSGSYRATSYNFGETTKREWDKTIAKPEAPWGELISRDVVDIMLPNDILKKIPDPKEVLTQFNNGIKGIKYLGDLEINGAEMYTPDMRNPGWGAHSGYPIVYDISYADSFYKQFCSVNYAWMWWHETGHNVQYDRMYISEKSGEITNNFFAAYNIDTYCNVTIGDIIVQRSSDKSFAWWENGGRSFSQWMGDYDLQFLPFLHLADRFGWESFRKFHQFYNNMRKAGDTGANIPDTYSQRMDLWYVVYSQIVGEDLSSFFKEWSVPLSQEAQDCVTGLGLNKTSLELCSEFRGTPGVQKTIGFNC